MATQPERKMGSDLVSVNERDVREEMKGKFADSKSSGWKGDRVDEWLNRLLSLDPESVRDRENARNSVETLGLELQRAAARQNALLKKPISMLCKRTEDGGEVGQSLVDLQLQVEAIDPANFNFEPGWAGRMMGKLPWVGDPMRRYFSRFQSVQSVVDAILRSLERGRDELTRDVITLAEDQKRMREMTLQLQRAIDLAEGLDQKLESRVGVENISEEKVKSLREEVLFPLRQRILDLQQQVVVNQQGVIASELIIRNNKELVRGVNRALNVTATALNVAATVALALESQKRVLDKLDSTGKVTSDLIASTANRLKVQGGKIHERASGTHVSLDSLKAAFSDLQEAMTDISRFRQEALPKMAATIQEFNQMSKEQEAAVRRFEKSKGLEDSVLLNLDLNG